MNRDSIKTEVYQLQASSKALSYISDQIRGMLTPVSFYETAYKNELENLHIQEAEQEIFAELKEAMQKANKVISAKIVGIDKMISMKIKETKG